MSVVGWRMCHCTSLDFLASVEFVTVRLCGGGVCIVTVRFFGDGVGRLWLFACFHLEYGGVYGNRIRRLQKPISLCTVEVKVQGTGHFLMRVGCAFDAVDCKKVLLRSVTLPLFLLCVAMTEMVSMSDNCFSLFRGVVWRLPSGRGADIPLRMG